MSEVESLQVDISIEEATKFEKTCEGLGATPSVAIEESARVSYSRCGVPFGEDNPLGFNRETLDAMRDAAEGKNLSRAFGSVEDMMADIGV